MNIVLSIGLGIDLVVPVPSVREFSSGILGRAISLTSNGQIAAVRPWPYSVKVEMNVGFCAGFSSYIR